MYETIPVFPNNGLNNLIKVRIEVDIYFHLEGEPGLNFVIILFFVWLSIHVFTALPNKLPVITNVLLYMCLAIVDINKLTILSDMFKLFQISNKIPEFLSVILHRDFSFSITLLTFANVYLTTSNRRVKIGISPYTFSFLFVIAQILRWTGAITYLKWNIFYECLLILTMMILTYRIGRWLMHLKQKEISV
ncbi:hypothetical protein SAMN04487897_10736 [Paenibacillus sp. yr247]|nr:hypothetical protein SAMN04487897_10736 [Paenibacillus sp. yr247]